MTNNESSQYTKEPWSINEWPQPDSSIAIGATGTPLIARVLLRDVSINGQKANARRIVACVNACEGVPTEQLEWDSSTFLDMMRERNTLEKQRDELHAEAAFQRNAHAMAQQAILDQGNQLGEAIKQRDELVSAIQQTLNENGHLADGDNCTLIVLKRALESIGAAQVVDCSTCRYRETKEPCRGCYECHAWQPENASDRELLSR